MLPGLRKAIDEHVGDAWRVTAVRKSENEYVVDVDCGSAVVRARGRTLEEAERRAAGRVWRRAMLKKAQWQDKNLESVLRACIAQKRRERGEPPVRLVPSPVMRTTGADGSSDTATKADEEGPKA